MVHLLISMPRQILAEAHGSVLVQLASHDPEALPTTSLFRLKKCSACPAFQDWSRDKMCAQVLT